MLRILWPIVPYSETRSPFHPESVLPFKVPESNVRESMREWYSSRWFAPNRLGVAAHTDTVRGVYLLYWTFDKHADAEWTAESGYYYYVDRTIRDSNGRSRTIKERRTRWEYSDGSLQHVLVPVWLLTYTYGSKNFQVIMNGDTGQIAGDYPYSCTAIP